MDVSDVSALPNLTRLTSLYLYENHIENVAAPAGLQTLDHFVIYDNPIASGGVPMTETNCPTSDTTAKAIKDFCTRPLVPIPKLLIFLKIKK